MASTTSLTADRARSTRRPWPLITAVLSAVAVSATAGALVARLVALWPEALAVSRQWPAPSVRTIDSLVAVPLLATGAAVAAWWALSLLLVTVTLAVDRAGLHSAALVRCVHAVAPRTLRRLAVAGVGASLTFSALPAHGAQELPDVGWTVTHQPGAPTDPTDPTSLAVPVPSTGASTTTDVPQPRSAAPQEPITPSPGPQPHIDESGDTRADEADRPDLAAGVVVVAPGDTLWALAADTLATGATDAEIATSWRAWYELNRAVIGADPDLLHPGQLLQAPPLD